MGDIAGRPSGRRSKATVGSATKGRRDGGGINLNGTARVDGSSNGKQRLTQSKSLGKDGKTEVTESDRVDILLAAIAEHDSFFSRMLDMIPESLVLPAKEVPEAAYASKFMKNKKEEAPQQARKEESKTKKRARYAAENQKTVLERQQERALEEKQEGEATNAISVHMNEREVATAGDEEEQGDDGEQAETLVPEVLRKKSMNVASMDALRKRIAERIKESQEKRKAGQGSRRAKAAERKNKEKTAKREKKKKASKVKKSKPKDKQTGSGATEGTTESEVDVTARDVTVGGGPGKAKKDGTSKEGDNAVQMLVARLEPELPPLPTVEDVGDIEFSGMRGVAVPSKKGKKLLPKVGAPGSKMRRLHGLLASAEEKKKRLEGLRQSEEGKEKAREEVWSDAMRVAGGEDVKDNPSALKKMIKRKEKEKAKSSTQWKDRAAGVRKEQAARQSKREENLNKRKSRGMVSALADTADREQSKRQRRPGFEGKRQDFINKEKPGSAGRGGKKRERGGGDAGGGQVAGRG